MSAHQQVDLKQLTISPLADALCLSDFDSGAREVDRHIAECCYWHVKYRRRVFCAFLPGENKAVGFYCLSISASETKNFSQKFLHYFEGRSYIPFIYIDYLGVIKDLQEKGIGTILLLNAIQRCSHTIKNIGVFGIALNAINERAAGLYDRYGFCEYGGRKNYPFMVLPAQSVLDLFP